MTRPLMHPAADWHEKLAEIHDTDEDLESQAVLLKEAEVLTKKSANAAASRNHLERLKAAPLLAEAKKKTFIAGAVGSAKSAESHVTHALAAAQIRAVAEGRDATIAAYKTLHKLLDSGDPAIVIAVRKHSTARIFGFLEGVD